MAGLINSNTGSLLSTSPLDRGTGAQDTRADHPAAEEQSDSGDNGGNPAPPDYVRDQSRDPGCYSHRTFVRRAALSTLDSESSCDNAGPRAVSTAGQDANAQAIPRSWAKHRERKNDPLTIDTAHQVLSPVMSDAMFRKLCMANRVPRAFESLRRLRNQIVRERRQLTIHDARLDPVDAEEGFKPQTLYSGYLSSVQPIPEGFHSVGSFLWGMVTASASHA